MAKIIDVQQLCARREKEVRSQLASLPQLCLASVAVGKDESAQSYRVSQKKLAESLKVKYLPVDLASSADFSAVSAKIRELNNDPKVTGIILNKPFPFLLKDEQIFSLLDERKDVEGMHPANLSRFLIGKYQDPGSMLCVSPTVLSVIEILDAVMTASAQEYRGKFVTLVGASILIGKPLALFLADKLATVCLTHVGTTRKDLRRMVRNAEILISAAGKPGLIKGSWIKDGAIVIDVSTVKVGNKLTGDVEFEEASRRAAYITPVPGGVGKLTPVFLFSNLVTAARLAGIK